MSILLSFSIGWLISHEKYINKLYSDVQCMETHISYKIHKGLFNITSPFKKSKDGVIKRKRKQQPAEEYFTELKDVSNMVKKIHEESKKEIQKCLQTQPFFNTSDHPHEVATKIYDESSKTNVHNIFGANADSAKCVAVNGQKYVFPENCQFYCKDVAEIESYLINVKYDLILLDPPWWNKYIRRKKAKTNHGYSMLYNNDLKAVPVGNYLSNDGIVVVWCTNSRQNLDDLKDIFVHWNVHNVARWFWLKVTLKGEPICNFSEPPGKQPFEQIIIGARNEEFRSKIPNRKVIFSVPSALHSHKPPLIELLQDFLPSEPKCLELFARYLLPNWTSWGLEAIKFQHESLFEVVS